jgi:uncharacterized protein YbcI
VRTFNQKGGRSIAVAIDGDHTFHAGPGNGALSAAISNAVVRLKAQHTGRGPTKAKTYVNRDAVTVVLQDTLTRGDHYLVTAGYPQHVLQSRKHFQNAMREDLVGAVERLTGRTVVAFLSDNSVQPDCAAVVFVLETLPEE